MLHDKIHYLLLYPIFGARPRPCRQSLSTLSNFKSDTSIAFAISENPKSDMLHDKIHNLLLCQLIVPYIWRQAQATRDCRLCQISNLTYQLLCFICNPENRYVTGTRQIFITSLCPIFGVRPRPPEPVDFVKYLNYCLQ